MKSDPQAASKPGSSVESGRSGFDRQTLHRLLQIMERPSTNDFQP
jgi:hypothetical protein